MVELIKAITYGRLKGLKSRYMRKLIQQKGMPATKQAGSWHVDPAAADEWIAEHCPRLVGRRPAPKGRIERPRAGPRAVSPAAPPGTTGEGIDQHIARLDQILAAFISTLHDGQFDARAVTGIKQVSAELRMLERHRVEMREREDQLVPKDRHERVIATIAGVVVEEIQAFASVLPEAMMTVLTDAGLKVDDGTMRLMAGQAEGQAESLRTRIADAIEASDV